MVLESTIICADNSEYMRNGDFLPSRLQAQQEAVSLICNSKTRSNPENNIGLLTTGGSPQVLATLTSDTGRVLGKLHHVKPSGDANLLTSIRIAHLALKHRQGRNHKMRIVVFVGSPILDDERELVKIAKRLKKEKVNVDIVSFGEEAANTAKLHAFITTINGKDGTGSHLATISPDQHNLTDALRQSPIVIGEDGLGVPMDAGGFPGGYDPLEDDPELALALRVSMEEQAQRNRQENEAARANPDAAAGGAMETGPAGPGNVHTSPDDAILQQALAMSLGNQEHALATAALAAGGGTGSPSHHLAAMTEEEQIAFAMQMSLHAASGSGSESAGAAAAADQKSPEPMETDEDAKEKEEEEKKKKQQQQPPPKN